MLLKAPYQLGDYCVYFYGDDASAPRLGRVLSETDDRIVVLARECMDPLGDIRGDTVMLRPSDVYKYDSFADAVEGFCRVATHMTPTAQEAYLTKVFPSKYAEIEEIVWSPRFHVGFGVG